ncbi:nuclear transport factor 2 family protein [Salinibacterium sp. ZJ450]|uniref:nuclear transport factor 2 family protein n=1 Tax=Salinibacterium sp. ZJ450 TaxID=2708338 RepID=UPI001420A56C|nr:nuclear transport factor 2 family protein [Salinibacterium sp. ZJ450]
MVTAEDELAIRNLAARFTDAASKRDIETWRATWTDDCHWYIGNRAVDGAETAAAFLTTALQRYDWFLMMSLSGQVFESDGVVKGVWYVLEYQGKPQGITQILGTYEDVYAKVDGAWKFSSRVFQSSYRGPLSPGQTAQVVAGGNLTLLDHGVGGPTT